MAVANWSSSAMVKAVLLPLILVVMAMAAGASSTEDGPAVAKSGGRFSETPAGRKLLTLNPCGSGSAPNYGCKAKFPSFNNATCCQFGTGFFATQACFDVGGIDLLKCGSCTTVCAFGKFCCKGVCVDLKTDRNNCGWCGHKCHGPKGCTHSLCDY